MQELNPRKVDKTWTRVYYNIAPQRDRREFYRVQEWCREHCSGDYAIYISNLMFQKEEDAVWFKIGYVGSEPQK